MKKLIFTLLLCLPFALFAQETDSAPILPPPGNAEVGDAYGAGVSSFDEKNAITVEELTKKLADTDKIENIVVKGNVSASCVKKGCWMTLANDENQKLFVKMLDYEFFVPVAIVGKDVVMQGTAENKVTSVGELRHFAEDAGKSKEEIAAITEPEEEIRFMAKGIKVIK
ncbi:MAG: DUF4920 domain-containing protein [Weeksellaceae bacterium]